MNRKAITLVTLMLTAGVAAGQVRPGNLNRRLVNQPTAVGVHEPFTGPVTAAKIRAAVEDAVMFLRSQQQKSGAIGRSGGYILVGETALAALTMLAAGANPQSDPELRKALDWLAKQNIDNTYVRGISANTWEYALRKVPYDKNIRAALKTDFDWLMKALGKKRAWRYRMSSTDWDNSCTQYGVLGVWAAARAGFEPGDAFWLKMSKHFRESQNGDGGWGYMRSGSTPNMATAGLASMFLVFDMYHGKSFYSRKDPRTFTAGEAAEVLKSIERGMTWLGKAKGRKNDGYYLYGIERTGVAGGRKYIGGEDWFARGALAVLKFQRPNGSIPMGSWGGQVVNTCFCTLFLVYGGAPVAFNKLEYGKGHDWNLNPRDLANLSKHLWSAYERPLNWQTVSIAAKPEEFEAPILFISGSKAAKFSETEMLKLREYVLRGGTILAEPSDHSEQFADSMRELLRQMFPAKQFPTCELKSLPADHGVYTALKQDWKKRPRLAGASDGSRTFFFLSEGYASADWQMNRTDSDAFKLAMNILFYATDLGALEGKFASILPAAPPAKPRKETVTVARVKHVSSKYLRGGWRAAAMCWPKFAPYVSHITGCELKELPPVSLIDDKLDGIRLLHITGRYGLHLTARERSALKAFVEGGGTVLVDAYAGSPAFAGSARAELEAVFGKLQPLPNDQVLSEGRFVGGVDMSRGIRFKLPARQLLRRRGETHGEQKLLIASVKDRPAVIFSEFDLSAAMAGIENYRSLGYKPASARKIVGNILAYIMAD